METRFVKDIAKIADLLDGKVEFMDIRFDQRLMSEEYRVTDVNNLHFVGKKYGVFFYVLKSELEDMITLRNTDPLSVLVGCDDSLNLYKIQ